MKNGKIGVTTENIFPVIKKFLYSDHEIFLRELISNAVDATQKLKTLSSIGEAKGDLGDVTIRVAADKEKKTLTVTDRGVGMTAEEVDKYINQIAFSGAEEFLEKYKNHAIIGHFGLGFYSAFMVADKVTIKTLSYIKDAEPVLWESDGSDEYTISDTDKTDVGTEITLYLNEESKDFAENYTVREVLHKYCGFMPVEIVLAGDNEDKPVNDTQPLWLKNPSECTDEEYKKFYHKVFTDFNDPLFWIHLNVDYPFRLKGILYFPQVPDQFQPFEGKVKLYSNQVFIADNVKEVIPEFLMLLKGCLDCQDLPLNVSRSFLQNDGYVKKMAAYITRKVADRLQELFNTMRPDYEAKWDDLKIFIQYGIITDEKFSERATDFMLWKNTEGKYFTPKEYTDLVKENQTDKDNTLVYLYAEDTVDKNSFIESAHAKGYDVLLMNGQLDNHYINWYESKHQDCRFVRVDSDIIEKLIRKNENMTMSLTAAQQEIMRPVFESQMPVDDKIQYNITFEAMDATEPPVVITQNEYMRRMKEMAAISGGGMSQFYGQMPDNFNIVVNGNHPIVTDILVSVEKAYGDKLKSITKKIDAAVAEQNRFNESIKSKKESELTDDEKKMRDDLSAKVRSLRDERDSRLREIGGENSRVKQIIDLALLSNGMLKGKNLTSFIRRSIELIER